MSSVKKYVPDEWHASNRLQYSRAEQSRLASQQMRDETARLLMDTDARTVRSQEDSTNKLIRRIDDASFWKGELERKFQDTEEEIGELNGSIQQLEAELNSTQLPLEVSRQCLEYRTHRETIDLVHDEPEKQLLKEVEVIRGVQNMLECTLNNAKEQSRILKSCRFKLGKDLEDKSSSLMIDEHCHGLTNESSQLGLHTGPAPIVSQVITPEQWQEFTHGNIQFAERHRAASQTLRGVVDGVISQCIGDIIEQRESTDLSLSIRIKETNEAKTNLENQLEQTGEEIVEVEKTIEDLNKGIDAKAPPLMVAHTRLDNRQIRPRVELVRDPPQTRLETEVSDLNTVLDKLRSQLQLAETTLKHLSRTKIDLEEDIRVKKKSLFTDQEQCVNLRTKLKATESNS
ncbi:hypothetical protein LOD99_12987 [Oopsacas minuta]|uniref:Tektin n=1 Tax=Oopsacas minuta TaxID=111878 RepID=A0AAV7JA19_9METZ|nr:hypothetical protein LOD99_12987 [Oopsacas minuta]